jgi:hypothetical protein
MMDINDIREQALLQKAKDQLERASNSYIKVIIEADKTITYVQLRPSRLSKN